MTSPLHAPALDCDAAERVSAELFGIAGRAAPLPSERDQNFAIEAADGRRCVLKVANLREDPTMLDAENLALRHVRRGTGLAPHPIAARDGRDQVEADGHLVRMLTWLPGRPMADIARQTPALLEDLGHAVATVDLALQSFDHPALHRTFHWDLAHAPAAVNAALSRVADTGLRSALARVLDAHREWVVPRLDTLPVSPIHNDANDYNVLADADAQRVTGLVDFGDMVVTHTVNGLAVAMAYAALDKPDPIGAAAAVARGYSRVRPLTDDELTVAGVLMTLRLSLSVCVAVRQQSERPDLEYLGVSQAAIRRTLPRLAAEPPHLVASRIRGACGRDLTPPSLRASADAGDADDAAWLERRRRAMGPNVKLSYGDRPLHPIRGWMQYLYDRRGRAYIDAYNNVPHVGHGHPRVAEAVATAWASLNTNTRYLQDVVIECAEALAARCPSPLDVCYFTASGSEANELALRLARAATGRRDTIVLDGAYHGHTTTMVDVSPYKHAGPGGPGRPDWVQVVPVPDDYRGAHRRGDREAGAKYAAEVGRAIERIRGAGRDVGMFLAETCPSVAGQIVPPTGYFAEAYDRVRTAGGLCIADEVQTGFGRIGTHFWAFEAHGVVPDILVLGKPIANGYPLGAVVTTRAIAGAFDNGLEFFSTFGGTTAAGAAALATLRAVEDEGLQLRAHRTGERLLQGLRELTSRHAIIGDVRGSGLSLGVELVRDRATLEPATAEASQAVRRLRDLGVLAGADGIHGNVLKLRGPMSLGLADADAIVQAIDRALDVVRDRA